MVSSEGGTDLGPYPKSDSSTTQIDSHLSSTDLLESNLPDVQGLGSRLSGGPSADTTADFLFLCSSYSLSTFGLMAVATAK